MDHVVVILVQTDVFCGAGEDSAWKVKGTEPQETSEWVLNSVQIKIKVLCFLTAGP